MDRTRDCGEYEARLKELSHGEPSPHLAEFLTHAVACASCSEKLDGMSRQDLDSLLGSEPGDVGDPEDPDQGDIPDAVVHLLMPSLSVPVRGQGEVLISKHGPYAIYAACEATSSLLRRCRARASAVPGSITWNVRAGVAFDQQLVVTRKSMAHEIVSVAGVAPPSSPESQLVGEEMHDWLFRAACDQPRLLSRFHSSRQREDLDLRYVPHQEVIGDVAKRWIPLEAAPIGAIAWHNQRIRSTDGPGDI